MWGPPHFWGGVPLFGGLRGGRCPTPSAGRGGSPGPPALPPPRPPRRGARTWGGDAGTRGGCHGGAWHPVTPPSVTLSPPRPGSHRTKSASAGILELRVLIIWGGEEGPGGTHALGDIMGTLGTPQGHHGDSLGALGTTWGHHGDTPGTPWGQSGGTWDTMRTPWDIMGTPWGHVGQPGDIMGTPLGHCGDTPGTPWGNLWDIVATS